MAQKKNYAKVPPEISVLMRYLYQDGGWSGNDLVKRFDGRYSKSSIYRHANISTRKLHCDRRKGNSGRLPKITPRNRRKILRQIPKLRKAYGINYGIKELRTYASIPTEISDRTIRRVLYKAGYKDRPARRKGILTENDLKRRLKFAREASKNMSSDAWKNSICFYLDGVNFAHKQNPCESAKRRKGKCLRKKNEGTSIHCTAPGKKEGTGGRVLKFMVAIAYDRGVTLCKEYTEKLNGHFFAQFIKKEFPKCFKNSPNPMRRLFLQDGDPSQNSALAFAALEKIGATKFAIPPRSPDLNPIENIFHQVRRRLDKEAMETPIMRESLDEYGDRVRRTLLSTPVNIVNKTISSMGQRIDEVKRLKGQRTKY